MPSTSKPIEHDPEDRSSFAGSTSRRGLIGTAAKLALSAPLALAALQPASALAWGGNNDDQGEDHDDRGHRFGLIGRECSAGSFAGFQGGGTAFPLVPVGQVNGGTGGGDFGASNPGSDGLGAGEVMVNGNHQVFLALRGAAANAGYDVQFERLNDHGREDLGGINTDGNGNFMGMTPNVLGGTNRVGAFVLIRSGADEYVSSAP
jgi:hypothetical protein